MRFMPHLHDTYVGQVVLVTVLLAWAVLVGLDVVMALSGEIGDLGTGNYTFGHAVAWVLDHAEELPQGGDVLVNLSGRGDKDLGIVRKYINL